MTELAIGVMTTATILMLFRVRPPRDRAVRERVRRLSPAGPALSGTQSRLARLGRRLPGNRETARKLLGAAALDVDPDRIIATRWLGAFAGGVVGAMLGPLAFVATPSLGIIMYRMPDFMLKLRAKRRRESMAAQVPDAVDLLAVCTQAGLNLSLAFKRVARRTGGALGDELRRMVDETELGVPRAAALRNLAERTASKEVEGLVSAISNADRFGTEVAVTLETFAQETRAARRRRSEEEARRAPVKILFPLVFLILPAFILLTVVPLLLGTFQTLGF